MGVILWQGEGSKLKWSLLFSLGNNLQELLSNPAEARAVQFLPDIPRSGLFQL